MELNKIYHMDAFEGLKLIPDKSIDMVLTDPPYGTTANKWDIPINLDALWIELKRITKDNAPILMFSQMPFTAKAVMSNPKMFRYEWIVEKENSTGFLNANRMPLKAHENILVFYKKLPVYKPQMRGGEPYIRRQSNRHTTNYGYFAQIELKNDGTRFPRDVLKMQWRNPFSNSLHPTQKPVSLCEYFIKTYTNTGAVILDPFMGSGTTAVAAINTGRKFIGFEKEQDYFDIAMKRIEQAQHTAPASALPFNDSRQPEG